jgi:hypothetical protein
MALTKLMKKYDFDPVTGFFSVNGCKLPREKRSYICLSYLCNRFFDAVGKNKYKLAEDICKKIKQLRIFAKSPLI